jgi:hypothetical protein
MCDIHPSSSSTRPIFLPIEMQKWNKEYTKRVPPEVQAIYFNGVVAALMLLGFANKPSVIRDGRLQENGA